MRLRLLKSKQTKQKTGQMCFVTQKTFGCFLNLRDIEVLAYCTSCEMASNEGLHTRVQLALRNESLLPVVFES